MRRWVRGTFLSRIKTFCLKCKGKIGESGIFLTGPSPESQFSKRFQRLPLPVPPKPNRAPKYSMTAVETDKGFVGCA